MGKTLKYVKDFDFSVKPCNYSCGGSAKKYAGGGRVQDASARGMSYTDYLNQLGGYDADYTMAPVAPTAPSDSSNDSPPVLGSWKNKLQQHLAARIKKDPDFLKKLLTGKLKTNTSSSASIAPRASSAAVANAAIAASAAKPSTGFKKGGAAKIGKVMGEYKAGKLHSGSKKGPVVTNKKQAVAIAISESRKGKK